MASVGAIWGPAALRLLRGAVSRTANVVRTRLADATRPLQDQAQHLAIRSGGTRRQPIHPAAFLKQQRRGARLFSSEATKSIQNVLRRFISSERGASPRFNRSRLPASNTSRRVVRSSGQAPFAGTLRPNLTGGAMPRTAGGYSLGGGARYFSHTPAAPAQVVENVSQAMRAFFLSGQKIRYDGRGLHGQPKYRAVSNIEDAAAMRKLAGLPRSVPGAFIDFQVSPKITALSPLAAAVVCASEVSMSRAEATAFPPTLNTQGFLDVLSADFGRAVKDLTMVYADIERLSNLGDLPIVLEKPDTLRIRFPGVDAATIEQLCDDMGVQRGVVGQDPGFDMAVGVPMALKFPLAPGSEKTFTSPGGSVRSLQGHELDNMSSLQDDSFIREAFQNEVEETPWLSEPEGYESISPPISSGVHCSDEFEGLEGIYRFLEECNRGKGRLG